MTGFGVDSAIYIGGICTLICIPILIFWINVGLKVIFHVWCPVSFKLYVWLKWSQAGSLIPLFWLLSKCLLLHPQIKSIYLSANDSLHFPLTKTVINKLIYQNMVHGPHRKITTNILIHHGCCGNRNMHFILLLLFAIYFHFIPRLKLL